MDSLTFLQELNQPTINVPRAALRFARDIAYPTLAVDQYLLRIESLAKTARQRLALGKPLTERAEALSDFLFYQENYRGNHEAYHDPQNSFLNCVLDRKLGIPITLSVLYVAVARRLGLPAYGIGLPGHFIVGLFEEGQEVLIDPFNAGLRLSVSECDQLVRESTGYEGPFQPKWLAPVSPINLLSRMLNNLVHAYIHQEDWNAAITVIQHLLQVQPEIDFHLRDLGYLYMYNGSLRLSAKYLEEYLRRSPDAEDFENVRNSLQIVAGRLALWN